MIKRGLRFRHAQWPSPYNKLKDVYTNILKYDEFRIDYDHRKVYGLKKGSIHDMQFDTREELDEFVDDLDAEKSNKKLEQKLDKLENTIEELKDMIKYMPRGEAYSQAKYHFTSLQPTTVNHNILNKIADKCLDERVKERTNKTYIYMLYHNYAHNRPPKFIQIKASSTKGLFLQIFNDNICDLLCEFLRKYERNYLVRDFLNDRFDEYSETLEQFCSIVGISNEFSKWRESDMWRTSEKDDLIVEFMVGFVNTNSYSDKCVAIHYEKLNDIID